MKAKDRPGVHSSAKREFDERLFTLDPLCDIKSGMDDWWISTGADPQFTVSAGNRQFEAGWYKVSLRLHVRQSHSSALPILYIDYGTGYSEESRVDLRPTVESDTHFNAVFNAHSDIVRLRLDPMTEPGHFKVDLSVFEKMTMVRAAACMIEDLCAPRPHVVTPSRWRLRLALMKKLLLRGRRGAGEWLVETYRNGIAAKYERDFADWVRRYDTIKKADRAAIKTAIEAMPAHPLISILMPTYNTPEKWLCRCIDSVREQIYPNWELCIADDASPARHVKRVLEKYAKLDKRIRFEIRSENGHISLASNTALDLAQGEFVALLDHDDELPPHALYMVAHTINQHPRAELIYSDEDKIDEAGVRFDPYFKPEWNADLFRGHNMISHLGVYKRSLLRELGGFRKGFEGSQDYDLALRATERLDLDQIVHIPHVLYHWRAIVGSTALGPSEKNYAHHAAKRALMAHVERVGLRGEFEELDRFHGNWSFKPKLTGQPLISIIIPTRDGLEFLTRCLESIRDLSTYKNYEIIIVDNQSSQPEMLRYLSRQAEYGNTRVLSYDFPFNYSAINNYAVTHANGGVLLFLNDDTKVITPSWMEEMAGHVMRPEVGAVGAMLYYPTDQVQHAGVILGLGAAGVAGHAYHLKPRGYPGQMCRMHLTQEYSAVTAACLMVRKAVFEQVGGFDESLKVAFNDIDLCLRIRESGFRIIWTPRAELYHYESVTRGSDDDPDKKSRFEKECLLFKRRWSAQLEADPYFNPNLRLDQAAFQFGVARKSYPWVENGINAPSTNDDHL